VQSVAVRLVVEREEARRAFHIAKYWDMEAMLSAEGIEFKAALAEVDGRKIATGRDFDADTGGLKNDAVLWLQEEEATKLAKLFQQGVPWRVGQVEQKKTKQRPQAPFITSTLQQAASSLLGFTPKRTMQVAQRLYEGVDLGGGEREGLITYMRTDSVTLSEKALEEAGAEITKNFGAEYYTGPRRYTTKSRLAQEAHEGIRPTHLDKGPEALASYLSEEELRLYRLIWNRTMASQMADAELMKTSAEIHAEGEGRRGLFRANGSVVTFPGFLRVADSSQQDTLLPALTEGMRIGADGAIALQSATPLMHETKPPARFNEATLVRRLEEEGIGRPSTYAPTISVIQQRGYVEKRGKALAPTFVGIAVTSLLRDHFAEYVDLKFTARMEEVLDDIAEGHQDWKDFLEGFYRGKDERFGHGLEPQIAAKMEHIEYPVVALGEDGDGKALIVRLGRTAPFVQRGEGGKDNTASLPTEITYDELTVEKALELIALRSKAQEALGIDPESGENIYCLLGPYGPYVQLGETGGDEKPKRTGLPKGTPMETVDFEMALNYIRLPRKLGPHPTTEKSVRASMGRFGPYVVCDGEYRSLQRPDDMFSITLEEAVELLAQPKKMRGKVLLKTLGKRPDSEETIELYEGRYGPYVTDGTVNASLPRTREPDSFTLEEALTLIAEAPAKKKRPAKKKKAAAKKKAVAKKKPAAKKKAAAKKKSAE
jgi:DNA topoisomerase I